MKPQTEESVGNRYPAAYRNPVLFTAAALIGAMVVTAIVSQPRGNWDELDGRSRTCLKVGQLDQAMVLANEALSVSRKANNMVAEATSLRLLFDIKSRKNEDGSAYLAESISILEAACRSQQRGSLGLIQVVNQALLDNRICLAQWYSRRSREEFLQARKMAAATGTVVSERTIQAIRAFRQSQLNSGELGEVAQSDQVIDSQHQQEQFATGGDAYFACLNGWHEIKTMQRGSKEKIVRSQEMLRLALANHLDMEAFRTMLLLSDAYKEAHNLEAAGGAAERAICFGKKHKLADTHLAKAYTHLGAISADQGDCQAAIASFEQALELAADDANFQVRALKLYLKTYRDLLHKSTEAALNRSPVGQSSQTK